MIQQLTQYLCTKKLLGKFLNAGKFHPISKITMLSDPTRCPNDPTFSLTMLGEELRDMLDRLTESSNGQLTPTKHMQSAQVSTLG